MVLLGIKIVTGVLSYGIFFANWQRNYPSMAEEEYMGDMGMSAILGALSCFIPVVGIMLAFVLTNYAGRGFRGFKFF